MSATPEQIAETLEFIAGAAEQQFGQRYDDPKIYRAAAALIRAQAEEIARLEGAAGEVWEEAYAEGAGDTAGWEKETAHAVLKWLDKEGDGFDIHHPDGNTTDAIIQGLYDAKRIGNLAELRAQAERVRVLESALKEARSTIAAHTILDMGKGDVPMHPKMLAMIDAALRGEA